MISCASVPLDWLRADYWPLNQAGMRKFGIIKDKRKVKIMQKIYEQYEKAFSNVSAYVILKDSEYVATVAFKYPNDGAGRLWCYLHVLGLSMVRAYAGGYGYDKASAAFTSAAEAQ